MDNPKNNKFYLDKIITDLKFIIRQTSNKTKEEILSNELLIDSIMFRIIQVHENSKCLSEEFIEAHKEVPWNEIRGMRNKIVHDYTIINFV